MIVIPNKNFTADSIRLVQLLNSTTKVNMLKACDKLDLYVSPNLKKDETARRIAQEMLDNPIEMMPSELSKALSTSLNFYLDMANKGIKAPSAKQLRMMSALGQFLGGKEL